MEAFRKNTKSHHNRVYSNRYKNSEGLHACTTSCAPTYARCRSLDSFCSIIVDMAIECWKSFARRTLAYVSAAPATGIGFLMGLVALYLGATIRIIDGVIEVAGGKLTTLVRMLPPRMRFEAITFGHVILGSNHVALETHRSHEHAHVRQYERWGILFFPLYLGSSLAQWVWGRDPHYHNHFEREAYRNSKLSNGSQNHPCHSTVEMDNPR